MAPDDGTDNRIELPSGGWAEIRSRMTVGDIKAQRQMAHDRGYPDEVMDSLALLPRMITAWSFGDVSEATIDELEATDAVALIGAIGGTTGPNPLPPSSSGGVTKIRKTRVARR